MDRLDRAIAEFEDETSDLTLGERVSALRLALIYNAFDAIQKIKKHGKKSPISEEEEYRQIECMKHFKDIEKMYVSQARADKLMGRSDDKINTEFLKAIRGMKSSLQPIVRSLKTGT